MIKALAAPYVGVKFMPTGGVNAGNINSYLSCDKVLACGGSWMVKPELITSGRFDEITRLTREAVFTSLGFRFDHIGINSENEAAAKAAADLMTKAFGFAQEDAPVSIWSTPLIETMKYNGRGTLGHFAIKTNSIPRAIAYLESAGVELDYDSRLYDDKGKVRLIYIKDEILGFAVHLC